MKFAKFKRYLPYLVLVLLVLALWCVYHLLHGFHWHDLMAQIRQMPAAQIWTALLLTAASYLIMTGYDFLALRYIDHPLPYGKSALAAGLGYAFSNNVGFSMLAGASIRYRVYSLWGLSAIEITQVVIFCAVSIWLGFFGLSGTVFLMTPVGLPFGLHMPFITTRPVGALMLIMLMLYIGLTFFFRAVRIKGWHFSLPSWRLSVAQLTVAAADWALAGAVLYALLPAQSSIGFGRFLAIYLVAQLAGLISQVPGGLGVFESVMLLLAPPFMNPRQLPAALLVFRGVYYILPLLVALVVLGIEELLQRQTLVLRARMVAGDVLNSLFIPMMSLAVFLTGAVLLFSGALPAHTSRLLLLNKVIPLPLLEASHFLGSLAGMCLLLLARGLQLRLDAAYVLSLVLLALGAVLSLLKGLDYEEATILTFVFLLLLPNRRLFFRRASLFSERFTPGWIAAIGIVVTTSIWLGLFAYRHVAYAQELWWHFSLRGGAPRFMRATVGALSLALAFALARLIRPAPPEPSTADSREIETIRPIVESSSRAAAHLALLGDKRFLINAARNAFIMYGVSGQSWVAMGDPVGPEAEWPELIWQFHRRATDFADHTVFYEVSHPHLHWYLDIGLSVLKLGEEARVPLADFSLEGSARKSLRYTQRKLIKQGCSFEIIPAADVARHLEAVHGISNAWLEEKHTHEKSFSLGFFKADYLCRMPMALIRFRGRPAAFGNVWQGGGGDELGVDLMRHLPDAPNGVMEYLFIELMLWGQRQGFRWFNLGMAPLSGMEARNSAPLWHRLGHWVSQHGEYFYNFQGLRQYKEKFDPVWVPKYLACPGGLGLPRILADIGALVSGGLKGMLFK
jgi:phosphatidylglycerol lysyltransferase